MNRYQRRFLERVTTAGPDDCWLWTGAVDKDGYGHAWNGGQILAHRFAWSIVHGDIPAGLCVLHSCDTPACCNPAHLRLGTQTDNMTDRKSRGRANFAAGTRHPKAKLTAEQVREIRHRYAAGRASARSLGIDFGVDHRQISRIVRRLSYVEVED